SSNIEDADVLTNTTAATTGTVHAITSPADLDDALEQILLSTLNCTFSLPSDFANADSLEVELGGTPISELGGGTGCPDTGGTGGYQLGEIGRASCRGRA